MGRTRQQRQQQTRLEEALAAQRLAGRSEGANAEREAFFSSIASRLFREEAGEVSAELDRGGFRGALNFIASRVSGWRKKWIDGFRPFISRIMRDAPVQTDKGSARPDFDFDDPDLAEYFENYLVRLSTQITETTSRKLAEIIRKAAQDGLSADETAKRVRELGEEFAGARSRLVASNEVWRAKKGAAFLKASRSDLVVSKTRRSVGDDRVRPEHRRMDGETVPISEPYSNGEMFCGSDSVRCRCVDTFNLKPEIPKETGALRESPA